MREWLCCSAVGEWLGAVGSHGDGLSSSVLTQPGGTTRGIVSWLHLV